MLDDFRVGEHPPESLPGNVVVPDKTTQTPAINNFKTPEQVAAADTVQLVAPLAQPAFDPEAKTHSSAAKNHRLSKFVLRWPPTKKEWIAGLIIIVLVVSGAGSWLLFHHAAKPVVAAVIPKVQPAKKATVAPIPIVSALTGLPTTAATNSLPVTAVMVENSTFARPQSGLSQAGVVFEAVAEGGITRFMALYQDAQPSNVGPIRSVRPYYEQWALGFDAAIAHVGGSPDALADLGTWNVRNLDEMSNGGSYHRISSRQAPHNVYTAIATLNQLEASKGFGPTSYVSWPRKADSPGKQVTAGTITLDLSSSTYNASYSYNQATNSYNRSEGGAIQTDANTGAQLSPKTVIAMVVPESRGALDTSDAYYTVYGTIGSGPVDIFQDGTVTTGTWSKASNTAQISFTNSAGQPIPLNAGQTWISAVGTASDISFSP